jgi:hypothetical protein
MIYRKMQRSGQRYPIAGGMCYVMVGYSLTDHPGYEETRRCQPTGTPRLNRS